MTDLLPINNYCPRENCKCENVHDDINQARVALPPDFKTAPCIHNKCTFTVCFFKHPDDKRFHIRTERGEFRVVENNGVIAVRYAFGWRAFWKDDLFKVIPYTVVKPLVKPQKSKIEQKLPEKGDFPLVEDNRAEGEPPKVVESQWKKPLSVAATAAAVTVVVAVERQPNSIKAPPVERQQPPPISAIPSLASSTTKSIDDSSEQLLGLRAYYEWSVWCTLKPEMSHVMPKDAILPSNFQGDKRFTRFDPLPSEFLLLSHREKVKLQVSQFVLMIQAINEHVFLNLLLP